MLVVPLPRVLLIILSAFLLLASCKPKHFDYRHEFAFGDEITLAWDCDGCVVDDYYIWYKITGGWIPHGSTTDKEYVFPFQGLGRYHFAVASRYQGKTSAMNTSMDEGWVLIWK